jgi:hypothetical protein
MNRFGDNIDKYKGLININELLKFRDVILYSPITKERSYSKLEEFNKPINRYIHKMLDKYKFQNGKLSKNTFNLNPQANFYFQIYQSFSNVIYLKPINGDHHASTSDRQFAFLIYIDNIIEIVKPGLKELIGKIED